MRWTYAIFAFLLAFTVSATDNVDVRVFSNQSFTQAQWRTASGYYAWVAYTSDQQVIDTVAISTPRLKRLMDVRLTNGELALNRETRPLGKYAHLRVVPLSDSAHFQVTAAGRTRSYEGELWFKVSGRELQLINHIPIPQYLAGVVQSEAGHFREIEFFKAQAVLAHTWLLANLNKHSNEGYNVKDDVTSQAYYGRADNINAPLIREAVNAVGDSVVVGPDGEVILGVFHANSGGQTANSQDAWSRPISYLQSISDTFSMRGSQAFWEVQVPKEEFVSYVASQLGVSASDANFRVALLDYQPREREGVFEYNGRRLKWKDVRNRFRLRSAWFSVTDMGQTVLLKGRGFGHGVGMSQEGANIMAQDGYEWKSILRHYFPGIDLVSSSTL